MAVTLTAEALAEAIGADDDTAARLLAVATAAIEDYGPQAPVPLQNEAVIRFAGYLHSADYGAVAKQDLGPVSVEYQTDHSAALRRCGAKALLSRYKRRRARTA